MKFFMLPTVKNMTDQYSSENFFFFHIPQSLELDFCWQWSLMSLRFILLFCHSQHDGFSSIGLLLHGTNRAAEASSITVNSKQKYGQCSSPSIPHLSPSLPTAMIIWKKSTFPRRPTADFSSELVSQKWWSVFAKEFREWVYGTVAHCVERGREQRAKQYLPQHLYFLNPESFLTHWHMSSAPTTLWPGQIISVFWE